MNKNKRIAVVGAGIAGLACAFELQKAGFKVVVFEKRDAVGGRMATRTKDGLPFDIGANHLCNLYVEIKKYCQEQGLEFKKMEFVKYGLFKDGKIVPLFGSVSPISRLKILLGYPRKRRIHDLFNLSEAAHEDHESAHEYARREGAKDIADYLVHGFSSTYQFHGADELSAAVIIGLVDSMRHDQGGWALHQLKGGMSALPEALAARLDVRLNTAVGSVLARDGKVEVAADGMAELYDAAVLATTANVSSAIYQNPTEAQRATLEATQYSATVSLAFRVPTSLLPDTSVVWVPEVQSKIISGYTNEMMKGDQPGAGRTSLLCAWLHERFARTVLEKSDEEIFSIAKHELMRVCPWVKTETQLVPYDLERWTHAMPKFSPGALRRVKAFLERGQGDQRVFLCGDYLNSLWIEGSLRGGQRAAEHVKTSLLP